MSRLRKAGVARKRLRQVAIDRTGSQFPRIFRRLRKNFFHTADVRIQHPKAVLLQMTDIGVTNFPALQLSSTLDGFEAMSIPGAPRCRPEGIQQEGVLLVVAYYLLPSKGFRTGIK